MARFFFRGLQVRRGLLVSVVAVFLSGYPATAMVKGRISGVVKDSTSMQPVEMAMVFSPSSNHVTYTDGNGSFTLEVFSYPGELVPVHVRHLGFITRSIYLAANDHIVVPVLLQPDNLELKEVVITATESVGGPSTSIINQQAMQHLQPSGISDLLELLPGFTTVRPNMSEVNLMRLRQVGSDNVTAFGTGFFIDGVPLSNDAGLQFTPGSSGDLKIGGRLNVANGIDMRLISTDDIESVEVIRGVPPARHGNISAGAVIVNRAWGQTPLSLRAKSDLNDKLLAIGKGFNLPGEGGVLNFNAELLTHKADPRDLLENFTRSTLSIRYLQSLDAPNHQLTIKASGSYLFTIDKEKADPELNHGQKDFFESSLSRYSFTLDSDINFKGNFPARLGLKLSSSMAVDQLRRERFVSVTGQLPQPVSMREGSFDAPYLEPSYYSHLFIEGKPVNLFSHLDFSTRLNFLNLYHHLVAGVQWQLLKNRGGGEVYDLTRPPFPGRMNARPRDFNNIPALQNLSAYIENSIEARVGNHSLLLLPGLRVATVPGLDSRFEMRGMIFTDPRVNASWHFPRFSISKNHAAEIAVHAAWGKLTRLPSLAHLYPSLVYLDIVELNYFSQDPALRRLHVLTEIEDPTNFNLTPVTNLKRELGLSLELSSALLSVTIFSEVTRNGFMTRPNLVPLTHRKFDASSVSPVGLTAPPELNLFSYTTTSRLYSISRHVNGAHVHKTGVEYQLLLPRLDAINTRFSVSGAWFRTGYGTNVEDYHSRGIVVNDEPFPYVGIFYREGTAEVREMLNTNLHIATNIPEHRLLLSLTAQTNWYLKTQMVEFDGQPDAYIDNFGNRHIFNDHDRDDPLLAQLVRSFSPAFFLPERVPVDLGVNLKVSKEIGENARFAFYVNRVFNYLPDYLSRHNTIVTRTRQPHFGMELRITI